LTGEGRKALRLVRKQVDEMHHEVVRRAGEPRR
jgi:hypothetical protein